MENNTVLTALVVVMWIVAYAIQQVNAKKQAYIKAQSDGITRYTVEECLGWCTAYGMEYIDLYAPDGSLIESHIDPAKYSHLSKFMPNGNGWTNSEGYIIRRTH